MSDEILEAWNEDLVPREVHRLWVEGMQDSGKRIETGRKEYKDLPPKDLAVMKHVSGVGAKFLQFKEKVFDVVYSVDIRCNTPRGMHRAFFDRLSLSVDGRKVLVLQWDNPKEAKPCFVEKEGSIVIDTGEYSVEMGNQHFETAAWNCYILDGPKTFIDLANAICTDELTESYRGADMLYEIARLNRLDYRSLFEVISTGL